MPNGSPGCEDETCCEAVCWYDPLCCTEEWDVLCADGAAYTCANTDSCGPGAGDCLSSNGTPGCEDEACCELVCTVEPLCCTFEWDDWCAETAIYLCVGEPDTDACGPGAGDCLAANGTPGCEDVACCEIICDLAPYCCNVEWDAECAAGASDLCAQVESCGPGSGSCHSANGTPGCEDPLCCAIICADMMLAECCTSEWDATCATAAEMLATMTYGVVCGP